MSSAISHSSPATLIPLPAGGVACGSGAFEQIVAGLRHAIGELAVEEAATPLGIPPLIDRATIERTGYATAFPHLLGSVHALEAGADEPLTAETDVVVLPAACYHVYPRLAHQQLAEPRAFDVESYCYRHEASTELGRLRAFRMREIVRVGPPALVAAWRDAWVERASAWLTGLGLRPRAEVANDPFFGPGARLLAASQREQQLKLELRVELGDEQEQAVVSCNRHGDHFSAAFSFTGPDGAELHSGCVAFGLERLVLALIHAHGAEPGGWPPAVRGRLGLAG